MAACTNLTEACDYLDPLLRHLSLQLLHQRLRRQVYSFTCILGRQQQQHRTGDDGELQRDCTGEGDGGKLSAGRIRVRCRCHSCARVRRRGVDGAGSQCDLSGLRDLCAAVPGSARIARIRI